MTTWEDAKKVAEDGGARLHKLPNFMWMAGITLGRHIFVKDGQQDCIRHEMVHVKQQREDGILFFIRYVFSKRWRVRYEAPAYALDVVDGRRGLDNAARALSGPLYGNACTFPEARAAILREASTMWKDARTSP